MVQLLRSCTPLANHLILVLSTHLRQLICNSSSGVFIALFLSLCAYPTHTHTPHLFTQLKNSEVISDPQAEVSTCLGYCISFVMRYPPENTHSDTGSSQQKVCIKWLATTLGVWDQSAASSLYQRELFSRKTTPWVNIPQLSRAVRGRSAEAKK